MEDIEFWRDIQGFEGLYQVSSLGRVKSLERITPQKHHIKERILNQIKVTGGYLNVNLCKDGKLKRFQVHRLVYQTFVGEIPEGMQVNHIDEDKTNNRVDNLNLMTPKENVNWGTRNERSAEKHSKQVIQYNLEGNEINRFPSTREVERTLGFAHGYISACCLGKINTAYSYIWRYA